MFGNATKKNVGTNGRETSIQIGRKSDTITSLQRELNLPPHEIEIMCESGFSKDKRQQSAHF